jgi:cytochrome P450
MANNPVAQAEAQAEIDAKIGNARLPEIADRAELPFVVAVMKETMRWRPALPLSIARRTKEVSEYRGYYVPGNTIVFPNVWYVPGHSYNLSHPFLTKYVQGAFARYHLWSSTL